MKRYTTFSTAVVLLASALIAAPSAAAENSETTLTAQTRQMDTLTTTRGEGTVSGKISSDFSAFAGSEKNSNALVTGLRNGSSIALSSTDAKGTTSSTTFTPPTGKMGYGNVYTSLALAKQQLAAAGISNPTGAQIEAALMGGTVIAGNGQTTTMTGVLELRAQGMGWGQIAHRYGYKLGPVISGMKSSNASVTAMRASSAPAGTSSGNNAGSGVVTAGGTTASGQGQGHAHGRGIVTGAGTTAGSNGNAYGRGIVTGGGAMGAQAGAKSAGHGKAVGKGN